MGWSFSCQPVIIQLKTSKILLTASDAFSVCLNLNIYVSLFSLSINNTTYQLGMHISVIYLEIDQLRNWLIDW